MVAAVMQGSRICLVQRVAREGLRVKIGTYCNQAVDSSVGVLQLPDEAISCGGCKAGLEQVKAQLKR